MKFYLHVVALLFVVPSSLAIRQVSRDAYYLIPLFLLEDDGSLLLTVADSVPG